MTSLFADQFSVGPRYQLPSLGTKDPNVSLRLPRRRSSDDDDTPEDVPAEVPAESGSSSGLSANAVAGAEAGIAQGANQSLNSHFALAGGRQAALGLDPAASQGGMLDPGTYLDKPVTPVPKEVTHPAPSSPGFWASVGDGVNDAGNWVGHHAATVGLGGLGVAGGIASGTASAASAAASGAGSAIGSAVGEAPSIARAVSSGLNTGANTITTLGRSAGRTALDGMDSSDLFGLGDFSKWGDELGDIGAQAGEGLASVAPEMGAEEAIGGGPEDPVADVAAIGTGIVGAASRFF
jgi:hypothetical protein